MKLQNICEIWGYFMTNSFWCICYLIYWTLKFTKSEFCSFMDNTGKWLLSGSSTSVLHSNVDHYHFSYVLCINKTIFLRLFSLKLTTKKLILIKRYFSFIQTCWNTRIKVFVICSKLVTVFAREWQFIVREINYI